MVRMEDEQVKSSQAHKLQSQSDGNAKESNADSHVTGGGRESCMKTTERQNRAEAEAKVRQRVATESRAFDVVNRLLEANITEDYLLQACRFIDHTHYGDIVEERSITNLCGYPLCQNSLPKATNSKKRYHISTRTNTVLDISERKKFCSNGCYQASLHLQKQIPQSPVWTRKDDAKYAFTLIQHLTSRGLAGEEVIGFRKNFPVKQELVELNKLDQRYQGHDRAARTRNKLPPEESQRLTDQLLSLSTEDESHPSVESLSDKQKSEETVKSHSSVSSEDRSTDLTSDAKSDSTSEDVAKSEVTGNGKAAFEERGVTDLSHPLEHHSVKRQEDSVSDQAPLQSQSDKLVNSRTVENEVIHLQSSMGKLGLQNSEELTVDSDGDDLEKKRTIQTNYQSQNCRDTISIENSDSSDFLFTREKSGLEAEANKTECLSQKITKPAVDRESGRTDLQQQAGESKTAYLMRLLERRKSKLSQVADIQIDSHQPSDEPAQGHSSSEETAKHVLPQSHPVPDQKDVSALKPSSTHTFHVASQETHVQSSDPNRPKFRPNRTLKENALISNSKSQVIQTPALPQPSSVHVACDAVSNFHSPSPLLNHQPSSPLNYVCSRVAEWITQDSLRLLGMMPSHEESTEEHQSSKAFHRDPEIQRKYDELCQRLCAQEVGLDDLIDTDEVDGREIGEGRRPVPDYEELKKQSARNQTKVAHFFRGPSSTKTIKPRDEGDGVIEADGDTPIVLPAVDSHNQHLIRRRIVLERLDRTMSSLLPVLELCVQDVSSPLRELVFTFKLTSNNILFKPVEWSLVAMILLRMLASQSEVVAAAFRADCAVSGFSTVLSGLGHSCSSVGQLVQHMLLHCQRQLQEPS